MTARTATFHVQGGVVSEGGDPLLHYVDRGGVFDLLRTCELPDGWYQFDTASGVTRLIAHSDDASGQQLLTARPRQHRQRQSMRRSRTRELELPATGNSSPRRQRPATLLRDALVGTAP